MFTPDCLQNNVGTQPRDGVLQDSAIYGYQNWPADDPTRVVQKTRHRNPADDQKLRRASRLPNWNVDKLSQRGKHPAEAVHEVLSSAKCNFNGVQRVRSEPRWLNRIRTQVAQDRPISLTYPLMCKIGNWCKQMTNVGATAGEFASLFWFQQIDEVIREIYPPGIRLRIVSDARLYNSAFGIPEVEVTAYMESIAQAIQTTKCDSLIELVDYTDLLSTEAPTFLSAHRRIHREVRFANSALLHRIDTKSLFRSVKASINTRSLGLAYEDYRMLFGLSNAPDYISMFKQEVESLTQHAFREVIAIRKACDEVGIFERLWPDQIRVTCHKGPKPDGFTIGLRVYPEYYGCSKLLPYHGVPLIRRKGPNLRLEIHPEVMLRGVPEFTRVTNHPNSTNSANQDDVFFYDATQVDDGFSFDFLKPQRKQGPK